MRSEILPYDFYQVCWAAIAYLRYLAVKKGANVDTKNLAGCGIKFKVSIIVWTVFWTSMAWKALVDLILPYYFEDTFGKLIGIVDDRDFHQRLIWIILLQFIQMLVEVYALTQYLMLTYALKRPKKVENERRIGNKWLERVEKRRTEKLTAAVSVRNRSIWTVNLEGLGRPGFAVKKLAMTQEKSFNPHF